MFRVELKLSKSKWSDSSGIRKLTSIPFYIYIYSKKNKKKKEYGNLSLQSQISHSANVDFQPFWLKYLELQKSIWCNLILLDSWLKDLLAYQIALEKELIWERYDFSKMTYEFCQQTGFMKNKFKLRPKASI
jgi:hypothetical protein